ncbi:hypothetical protein [Erysipelothrix tonsillarum]|uniref:hypothetical protein n=1 Tax=Erysipelothrix tonsillarum TaxID=38402 RepID=UPI0039C7E57C
MKISDVEKRINASYNTIKRFIEKDDNYNEIIDNVLHATNLGIEQLEMEYGIRTEILSDDNIDFYKNQILFLRQQLEENKQYNQAFIKQIESKDYEAEENKKKIKELEDQVHQQDLEKLELQHKLELEKNKSVWKKIFQTQKKSN